MLLFSDATFAWLMSIITVLSSIIVLGLVIEEYSYGLHFGLLSDAFSSS